MNVHERRTREWLLSAEKDRVRGYLQDTQARALNALLEHQSKIGLGGSLAEIGIYLGKTLIGLARAARPGEHVLGVDPLLIGKQDLLPELSSNLRAHLSQDELSRVMVRRLLSTQLDAHSWMASLKAPARFVHLDGHHARETILHDLQLASSWLQKGGLVVIDDFLNELHPDLTSGILDGLEAHRQLEPVAVIPRMGHIEEGGSKLVCVTRGDGEGYRAALDRALSDHLRPWTDRMLGREVRVYRSALPSKPDSSITTSRSQPKPIPVVFALSDPGGSYWVNTAVAMTSVAQYAKGPISIHVLHDESLHELAKARLAEIAREMQVEFSLVPVALPSTINAQRLRQFGPASLFRLMIPALFADEPVVIYLDSDLVANGLDIADLAAAASETAAISAVRDPNIAAPERHAQELSRMSLDPAEYVNSGVLVFRPKLISVDLLEQFSEFSEENPAAIHPDQDFINSYFMGRIHFLDDRFNFQVALYDRAMLRPLSSYAGKIVHYAGKIKPLDGNLAPGLLPFFIHAYRVRELSEGLLYEAQRYLLPVDGNADALTMMRVDGRSG